MLDHAYARDRTNDAGVRMDVLNFIVIVVVTFRISSEPVELRQIARFNFLFTWKSHACGSSEMYSKGVEVTNCAN